MEVAPGEKVLSRDIAVFSSLFFGFTGLDRLYTGCYMSGTIKFLFFLCFMMIGTGPLIKRMENQAEAKLFVQVVVVVWYLYDLINILYGAITSGSERQFCGGYVWMDSAYSRLYASVGALLFLSVAIRVLTME